MEEQRLPKLPEGWRERGKLTASQGHGINTAMGNAVGLEGQKFMATRIRRCHILNIDNNNNNI